MFIALQIPVTDARPFIESETYKLDVPAWSLPRYNKDFVKTFGVVRERRRGGVKDWLGEGTYCQASGAVRFQHPVKTIELGETNKLIQYCAFRRLLVNSPVSFQYSTSTSADSPVSFLYSISRLEIGFGFRKQLPFTPLKGKDCLNLIKYKLNQEIKIKTDNKFHTTQVIEAGQEFAKAYLQATTRHNKKELAQIEEWWCEPGAPLLVFEYVLGDDVSELPKFTRYVQSETLTNNGIQLSYTQVELNNKRVPVWFLGTPPLAQLGILRQLRINLMRFHAERECIKQIFRLVLERKIIIKRDSPATQLLQEFLLKSISLLSKESREGVPQSSILDIVNQADEIVNELNRKELLRLLSDIRRNLFNNIKSFIEKTRTLPSEPVYYITHVEINDSTIEGDLTMPTNIMHGVTVHGNVNQVAAQTVSNSFNTIQQSGVSDELKLKLEDLSKAVGEMLQHLPEEKQKEVAQDLKVLTDEVTSKTPRKKWYELSAEGLIEAAKTVGEIAAPVITTAKAVLALLA